MNKTNKILEYIKENNLDGVYISTPRNIEYLTGFASDPHERILGLLIKNDGTKFMICPKLEEHVAKRSTSNINIIPYLDTENGFEKFSNITGEVKNIAIEKDHLTVERYEKLKKYLKSEFFTSFDQFLKDLRKYKSSDEIEKIRSAAKLADKAIEIASNNLKEGISELELKSIIDFEIKKYGVTEMSFDTMVLFGTNAADPHGNSGDRKLKLNEHVLIDLGCYFEGYASDITRTLEFGKVSDEAKNIYDLVLKANTEAISACKPGVRFCDIDKIARDIITEGGYGEYFTHRLGHGLGMDCHEFPDVSEKTKDILEEGMVFTIEPGIYFKDITGVRIEDDIVITKDGFEVLTKFPK